jgi:hypothetical protein
MSINSKLHEHFVHLPKLNPDGTNYIVYQDRFGFTMEAAGLGAHIDEKAKAPEAPAVVNEAKPTEEETKALDAYSVSLANWNANEAVVKQAIAATIPDSLFLKVKGEKTSSAMWQKMQGEFEKKSQMVIVDLRRRLQEKQCAEGDDVKTHLDELQRIHEDLIAMGADSSDENFIAIMMGSLPTSYDPYLSTLTATSTLLDQKLTPDVYLRGIRDEADRHSLRKTQKRKDDREVTFFA